MFKPEYLDMSKIIKSERIVKLFAAVEEHGGSIRFVGGAVRDTLAGLSGFDLDLATDLSPDELVEACEDFHLKTVPIGLKTDTIGVVIDNQIMEVSSLKHKNKKHNNNLWLAGYTDDWSADASQRDLTINAVYADLQGNVFDYYNGIDDLEKGIVRFIGNPNDRIQEDYLRIMRFFRFYSIFGKQPINQEALQACIKHKKGLRKIAIERVRDELFKLLTTPHAAATLQIIFENDILGYFLPPSPHLDALERLTKIVSDANYEGNFLRRLFVMYQPNSVQADDIARTLRFTKKQKETFVKWALINLTTENMASKPARNQIVYRYGKQFAIDKILMSAAIYDVDISIIGDVLREIDDMIIPIFPLRGRDLLDKVTDKEQIGIYLSQLEQAWIDSDFSLNREELLHLAEKIIHNGA